MTIATVHAAIAKVREYAAAGRYKDAARAKTHLYNDYAARIAKNKCPCIGKCSYADLAVEVLKVEDIEILGGDEYE